MNRSFSVAATLYRGGLAAAHQPQRYDEKLTKKIHHMRREFSSETL